MLYAMNLTNIIKKHTRITDKSKTLIDLVISSNISKIAQSGTYESGISDHDLIFVTFIMSKPKFPKFQKFLRKPNTTWNVSPGILLVCLMILTIHSGVGTIFWMTLSQNMWKLERWKFVVITNRGWLEKYAKV